MRFLADENFPAATARALAGLGHDIVSVMTTTPGASDLDVLARAERERRVLLTFDKDFGDLARSFNLSGTAGSYCSVSLCRCLAMLATQSLLW